ncbi:tyrosine-protein phosphatase [Nocardia sp. NPDC050406]|uniref:tyrosine-protein phosphatase n=1 Tax=Nocardia sp. NPDC050406 TaxID=3364318 RepID=UPI00379C1FA0
MTISRAVRGSVAAVAAAFLAVLPAAATGATATAAPSTVMLRTPLLTKADSMGITAPNARDVGGYAAQSGNKTVRNGLVFRSDALDKLTAADHQKLTALGLTEVLDLRSPTETAANPDKLPGSIPRTELPIYDPNNDFYTLVNQIIGGGPAYQQEKLGNGKGAEIMRTYYRWFVTDATTRGQFAAAIRAIADAEGPILYHCTAGKDRTGITTAILFSILGVSREDAMSDFLLSNDRLAASNKATLDYLVSRGLIEDRSLIEPLLGVQADFLESFYDQVSKSYSNMEQFVMRGLGIDAATVAKLQDKLLQQTGGMPTIPNPPYGG